MGDIVISARFPWSDGSGPAFEGPYAELASAIVLHAVKDYMMLLKRFWKKDLPVKKKRDLFLRKAELEDFFYSGWYETLTDLDPEALMEGCMHRAFEQEKEMIRRQNMKRINRQETEKTKGGCAK